MIQIGQLHVFLESREIRLNGERVRIGSRAFDILELLIRAEGALVSKDEIIRCVWPTTIVQENNLQVHIAALRKALGPQRDLIRTVPGRGYCLVGALSDAAPKCSTADLVPPLPVSASALVGREASIAQVADALGALRIVTLVGSGGIGKTRVATEVAARVASRFPDGVVFVPLASVSDPRFVADALADALPAALAGSLGMARPAGRLALADIVPGLAGRRMLLVLDNCEHLIDVAAQVATAATAASEGLCVLATSREALRIPGELLHQVPPLDVPGEADTGDAIVQASAVQLFIARARAADARFPLNERTLCLTAAVCRRLDGIPLAIELAAARAAVLGVEVLADHLDDHFRILAGGFRTALPRHQTLKAMLDWSYRLLDETERTLLRWLGVFMDGFSFDAAYYVVSGMTSNGMERSEGSSAPRGFSQPQLLDALSGLVAKSLVIRESADAGTGTDTRYRLLAITRAYALQKLEDCGERKEAALAHATYFHAVFSQAPSLTSGHAPGTWFLAFRRELGNLRAALDWAFAPGGDAVVGIALAAVAVPCLFDASLIDECCERARAALDATLDPAVAPVPPETRLRLLAAYGAARVYTHGPVREVLDVWADVLTLALETDSGEYQLRALWGLASACRYAGNVRAALAFAQRFRALATRQADLPVGLIGLRLEAIALHYAGEQEAARERLDEMLAVYAHPVHRWNVVGFRIEHGIATRATLARVLWTQGETREALRVAQDALDAAMRYEHDIVTCYVLVEGLVPVALLTGAHDAAREGIALLETRAARTGFVIWSACCACYAASLKCAVDPQPAHLREFAAALDGLRKTGYLAPLTLLLGQYARGLRACGRHDEAAAALDEAKRHSEANGEHWFDAELRRIGASIPRVHGPGGLSNMSDLSGMSDDVAAAAPLARRTLKSA
ncbi:Transcriptional regulator [Paraburkholderia kururiensis]|uniref:winged helix-turn-helix domain-containing protein n=1 Tax=Paraburkholderia kururiensis TaxID=984307 RepID=UPI0039A4BC45